MDSSDESLLRRFARHRDFAAFDQLHLRYRDRVLNFAWRYCGDYQRAEEATQDTFLKILRQARRFRFEGKVASWIFRIALNQARGEALGSARKRRIFREETGDGAHDPPAPGGQPDRIASGRETEATVRRCLDALPPRYRQPLLLNALEGLSQRRIAEIMKCRIGTVGSLLSRGRRAFRDLFLRSRAGKILEFPPRRKRHIIADRHEPASRHPRPHRKASAGGNHPRRKRPAPVPSRPLPGLPGRKRNRGLRRRRVPPPSPPKSQRGLPKKIPSKTEKVYGQRLRRATPLTLPTDQTDILALTHRPIPRRVL